MYSTEPASLLCWGSDVKVLRRDHRQAAARGLLQPAQVRHGLSDAAAPHHEASVEGVPVGIQGERWSTSGATSMLRARTAASRSAYVTWVGLETIRSRIGASIAGSTPAPAETP